ncbi:hypothetical protein JCM11491_002427 [Sporobolomyces phaffii]
MLSAVRQRATISPASSFASGSTRSVHSTRPAFQLSTRQRLAKDKAAQRYAKILKKRDIKDLRQERLDAKEDRALAEHHRRLQEAKDKQIASLELTENLAPFTDAQLESMYRGLIAAQPAELSFNAIEQSKAPALPDPTAATYERQDRLVALSERLDDLASAKDGEEVRKSSSESLTERLRRKRAGETTEVVHQEEQTALNLDTVSTPAVALLQRVEELSKDVPLVPQPSTSTAGLAASLPKGLLARSEWIDLVLACAQEGDTAAVIRGLQAMEATVPLTDGKVLEDVLALYAIEGRPQDAVKLTDFARKNSLPLSVTAHHHLLTSLLPSHPELAVRHLYSMEALGYTPLAATYTSIVSRLLSPQSPPTLVRKGWDLYAHSRLVSHPVPSVELYATMIQACSRGTHPSPERAIDLFTELTDDNRLPPSELAFNGVIRSCAREGTQEYYYEALRYTRRMLDDNVEPSKYTFHALLEGAKRHGDLARARWMLVKMVGASGKVKPDENTLGLVFQTYASYRPEGGKGNETTARVVKNAVEVTDRPSPILKPEQDPANAPIVSRSSASSSAPSDDAGPLALIELLGEASLFYPGPLPKTSAQVLEEAENLMVQIVGREALGLAPLESSPDPAPSMFPGVQPSTFLLNAYLSILNSHSTLAASLDFFDTAYRATEVEKNRYSYEVMMKRCELGKASPEVVERAKKVFEEWIKWSDAACPEVTELKARKSEGEPIEAMEVERVGKLAKEWDKQRRNGRNVAKMWGGLVRILAKAYQEDEALKVLRQFVQLYPAADVANFRPSLTPIAQPDKAITRVPLQLSSSLYPETAPSLASSLPPHLVFNDLKVLHLRCANIENLAGLAYVKGVSKAYEAGLAHFKRWEATMSKTQPTQRGPPPEAAGRRRRSPISSLYLAVSAPLLAYLLLPSLSVPDLSKLAALPANVASSLSKSHDATCPAQVDALNVGTFWKPEEDVEYVQMATERFQGALKIATESWDDMHIDPYQEPRYAVFEEFHRYLEQAFPTVHSKLLVEKVSKHGLLITYKGKEDDKKPIVLMAHQDVVPVNSATARLWTHPPYDAIQDAEGWIWARGATDCKNTLIGILAAFERLALEGFEPSRSIILSSGFDEEIGGKRSAPQLAHALEERYGRNGVAFIIDEGISGVFDAFKQTFVVFAVAEKGFANLKIEVHTPGGHSSVPLGTSTGIGIMSKLVTTLEENAPQPNLDVGTPLLSFLSCAAEYGTVERMLRYLVKIPLSWGKLGKMLAKKHPLVRAFITTAQSVTLVNGGIKMNALPEFTSANVNYRIDFLSSINATLQHAVDVLAPVVSSFNLTFDAFGTHPDVHENVVRLSTADAVEPAPISPTHGASWDFVAGTARQVFDNAIVGPSGMIANTDTKYYWNTTEHIYRFIPGRLALMKAPHTVDERIHIDAHIETIKFFYKLAQNSQTWSAP